MKFIDRVKKEMSEGIVRALLEDANYRVIDLGIEKFLREVSCLPALEYCDLNFPDAMRLLPDLMIMDREQTAKDLVEVRYRSGWGLECIGELKEKVSIFKHIIAVFINPYPDDPKNLGGPSRYLRCCRLKFENDVHYVHLRRQANVYDWVRVDEENDASHLWWAMTPIQEMFPKVVGNGRWVPLSEAIEAISGILS